MTEPTAGRSPPPRVQLDEATRRELLGLTAAPVVTPFAMEAPPLAPTDAAIVAAICDTFLAEDLERAAGADQAEVEAVLAHSGMVMMGGVRRLRLSDEVRAQVVQHARGTANFRSLLAKAHEDDTASFDAVGNDEAWLANAWLRSFLVGHFGDLTKAPVEELRAAITALERLRGVPLGVRVPSYEEARRLLGLAELLEPLRVLIGASGGWDGTLSQDRFVGRENELRMLRGFVDELDSEGVLEAVSRGFQRATDFVASAVSGAQARVLMIEARGGLGKTALVAKFMLDHALAKRRFPFAYLDFDRAALQPRDPRLLLVEVARQLGLQFTELAEPYDALSARLRAEVIGAQAEDASDPFVEFRDELRGRVAVGKRVFLLVLDTLEVVQFDPQALEGLIALLDRLTEGGFPELRVVAVGRADIPELRSATLERAARELHTLTPLPYEDAVAMASRLGKDLLGASWRPAWSSVIVGSKKSPPTRREPLTIRIAVELLRAGEDEAERHRMAAEIHRRGDESGTDLVAILYQKRVIEHVRDPEVRALAWPGLVVRRVTRKIAAEVLAAPCGLAPTQAEDAFERLRREVWIVQPEGDGLRHRPDLRARMMPLMRSYQRGPEEVPGKLFQDVNEAAIAWFGDRRHLGDVYRAEWLYHRLLSGEPPEAVEQDWTDEIGTLLAGTEEDFEPDSAAVDFLAALTARRPLPARRLAALPPRLALEHLARTAPDLGMMHDARLQPRLRQLPLARVVNNTPLTPPAAAAACTLAVKTGAWRLPFTRSVEAGAWRTQQEVAQCYLRARTPQDQLPIKSAFPPDPGDFASHTAVLGAVSQDLAAARLWDLPGFETADAMLARILKDSALRLRAEDGSALRLAIAFGEQSHALALQWWLSGFPRLWWGTAEPSLSLLEARALTPHFPPMANLFRDAGSQSAALSWFRRQREGQSTSRRLAGKTVLEVLQRALVEVQNHGAMGRLALRRFAAARDEDWLTPMAYAAWRACNGRVPDGVFEILEAQQEESAEALSVSRRSGKWEGDILMLLRRADEASSLAAVAALFLRDNVAAEDLRFLLAKHAEWRNRTNSLLGSDASFRA